MTGPTSCASIVAACTRGEGRVVANSIGACWQGMMTLEVIALAGVSQGQ
jgi:hypothetical protein